MIIFDKKDVRYVFIHIPKNSGKSFMENLGFLGHIHKNKSLLNIPNSELKENIFNLHKKYTKYSYEERDDVSKIQAFWHIDAKNDIDMAHIPYKLITQYASSFLNHNNIKYMAIVRNPYTRIIASFNYKCAHYEKELDMPSKFKHFIKNVFASYDFDVLINGFSSKTVHFFPQHTFLTDASGNFCNKIRIEKLDDINTLNEFQYNCNSLKEVKKVKPFYDQEVLDIINKQYEKDFLLLNYKKVKSINELYF